MAAPREYELVLMLDPGRDAPARDALAEEAKKQIASGGGLKHENNWGLRKLAYEIGRRNEADYRWFRFEASNQLLEGLDHSLKIADGVLRFRIFRVDPDAPVMVPPAVAAPAPGRDRDRDRDRSSAPPPPRRDDAPPADAAPADAAPADEAPADAPPAEAPPADEAPAEATVADGGDESAE